MSTNKRTKIASQQMRMCACGKQFTSRAYGHHVVDCLPYHNLTTTRRVYHVAATNHAANAAPQQQNLTMHQQRQWINRGKVNVESSAIEQRHNEHKVTYNNHLKQMTTTAPPVADDEMKDTALSDDDDDGEHDSIDSDDCSVMFDSMVDQGIADDVSLDNDVNDANVPMSADGAPVLAATGHILPPIFPNTTDFDHDDSIRFDSTVAPCTAAGIKLMEIIGKHSVDLTLYNDIVCFIGDLADAGYNFTQKLPKRKALHTQCEQAFNYSSLRPKLLEVPVATLDTPTVTMPVFDIKAVLAKMLQNPLLMQEANIAANYDVFTGKPLRNTAFEDQAYYDEIHTGQQWQTAVNHYCGDSDNLLPCGLVVFYDKSHADRHGSLAVSPIMFTLTLFNKTARAQCKFWDILAYVPNLDSGTNKTADSSIGREISSAQKVQDEHVCLANALRQLKDVNDSGGIPMRVMGRKVKVMVWIHIMVGDISGNNGLLGSYNTYNAKCPYRDCSCAKESFLDPNATCTMIRKADIDRMKKDNDVAALQAASKHNIINAFDTIPTGNPVDTIYHLTPPETMHAINSGIVKRMIENIGDQIKSKKQPAAGIQNLHLLLIKRHSWQSERNASSRPSSRNHIFDTSKTQATEMMGNLFMIMCALHTSMGQTVCRDAGVSEPQRKGKIETIKMILALEKWFNRRTLRSDIDDNSKIQSLISQQLIPNLQKFFPRKDGTGWMFPKVHSLTKFPVYMQMFGSAINFYGGFGESHLKTFMKKLAHFTQRRATKFAIQLGENHYQQSLFTHSSFAIRMQTKSNFVLLEESVQQNFRGFHRITFTQRSASRANSVEYITSVDWPKQQSSKPLDDILRYTISRYMATNDPSRKQFHVTAYTEAKLPNNKETLESYDAGPTHSLYKVDTKVKRFDWCMILTHAVGSEEADERLDTWAYACPAQIHGFIRFDTGGVRTPRLLQNVNADMVNDSEFIDETMYVVVRTHKDFLSWRELEKQFVVPIQLGNLDDCTYILPVSRIVNPLYVFEDHGQPENTSNTSFFATLPARYSAFHLDYKLNPQLIPGEGGLSQKCEEV